MSLEAPTTEMVSLQVFVGQHRHTGIQSSDADQCRAPRETIEKKVSKIGVDFCPKGGVDLAWILRGRESRAEKNRSDFGTESVTKFVPVSAKIRDRIRAANQKSTSSFHPIAASVLASSRIVF